MNKLWCCLFVFLFSYLNADCFFAEYERMNKETFFKVVVGNTIVGITRQSKDLYMLYFQEDGLCQLWKENQIYHGNWWIDCEFDKEDIVHAIWPTYFSKHPQSLFSQQNPSYGKPTSLRYYINRENGEIIVAGKKFYTSVLLVPGYSICVE